MEIIFTFMFLTAALLKFSDGSSLTVFKEPSPCGKWTPYKNEKCLKIAVNAGHQTYQDAEIVCESFSEELQRESYPKLITIKTKEEQEFLEKFLFVDNKIEDRVWLGLKEVGNSGEFAWNDGTKLYYTNWANQTVSDNDHHCVQLESGGDMAPVGLWIKVKCQKATTVVCERTQTLNLETLQNLFFSYKLEQDRKDEETRREIADLKRLVVPIGFIYPQLPGQDPPTVLWPGTNWTDISPKYAGLFFRVVGGKSAPFGQVQEGDSKRLEQVGLSKTQPQTNPTSIPADGSWSTYIYTGGNDIPNSVLRFRLANQEVRPQNQAMIVWQRIK